MTPARLYQFLKPHGEAIVAGNMDRAIEDFSEELRPHVGSLATQLPQDIYAADVLSVKEGPKGYVVQIRYSGKGTPLTVETIWEDRAGNGRPFITDAKPV